MVFTESYFLDPSHVRMSHPYTIKYMLESEGFEQITIDYMSKIEDFRIPYLYIDGKDNLDNFNEAINKLNDIMFGYRDYAVIGRK